MDARSIVLLSGGIDSTVCAEAEHRSGTLAGCVFFDYGQPNVSKERHAAHEWTLKHEAPFRVVRLDLPLMGAMKDPTGTPGSRVVPGRNLLLLSHAIAIAAGMGVGRVVYGATGWDDSAYPDCRRVFVESLSAVSLAAYGVRVEAPLLGLSKVEVVQRGQGLGVHLHNTWSCYTPLVSGDPCSTCNACLERAAALGRA